MTVAKEKTKSAPLSAGPSSNGVAMARPASAFVESPPLLANTATLLNRPELLGVKLMTRFVQSEACKWKGVPDSIAKGLGVIEADPLSVLAPPLLTIRVAWAAMPVATRPKSRLTGVTTSCGG